MSVKDIRVEQLRQLIREQGGSNKAAAALLKKKPAQISQWLSGYRTITEDSAREIEAAACKPHGWMDALPPSAHATAHAAESRPEYLTAHKQPQLEQALPVVLEALAAVALPRWPSVRAQLEQLAGHPEMLDDVMAELQMLLNAPRQGQSKRA